MPPAQQTRNHIIDAAISVLKTHGTEGLTMRKVASEAEMSLGNLQYHFKDRPALMAGLAERYFGECAEMLNDYQHTPEAGEPEEKLRNLILFLLDHVDHISDMCRIFREIWALSARDENIHAQMVGYYEITITKLSALLAPLSGDGNVATRMAHLLVPYIEGYSITFKALSEDKIETAEMLAKACWALCQVPSE